MSPASARGRFYVAVIGAVVLAFTLFRGHSSEVLVQVTAPFAWRVLVDGKPAEKTDLEARLPKLAEEMGISEEEARERYAQEVKSYIYSLQLERGEHPIVVEDDEGRRAEMSLDIPWNNRPVYQIIAGPGSDGPFLREK